MSPADGWWWLEPWKPSGAPQNRAWSPAPHPLWELPASGTNEDLESDCRRPAADSETRPHAGLEGGGGARHPQCVDGSDSAVTAPGSRRRAQGGQTREPQS